MTREQWTEVEKALSGRYGKVTLRIEGREITLVRELVSKNKLGVVVYVDGKLKSEWIGVAKDCDEQRFMYPSQRFVYSARERDQQKRLLKRFGKRWLKEQGITDPNKKATIFLPFFPSATAARRHFQKNFPEIELVEASGV
jgi:hypothetical protein